MGQQTEHSTPENEPKREEITLEQLAEIGRSLPPEQRKLKWLGLEYRGRMIHRTGEPELSQEEYRRRTSLVDRELDARTPEEMAADYDSAMEE